MVKKSKISVESHVGSVLMQIQVFIDKNFWRNPTYFQIIQILYLGFIKKCYDIKSVGGWASIGGVCKSHNVALACHDDKADEVSMGRIMAHEIGHLLGM